MSCDINCKYTGSGVVVQFSRNENSSAPVWSPLLKTWGISAVSHLMLLDFFMRHISPEVDKATRAPEVSVCTCLCVWCESLCLCTSDRQIQAATSSLCSSHPHPSSPGALSSLSPITHTCHCITSHPHTDLHTLFVWYAICWWTILSLNSP